MRPDSCRIRHSLSSRSSRLCLACAILFAIALSPLHSAEPRPEEPAKTTERFPIGFWYGPPPKANQLETWQKIAEAHFTLVGPCSEYSVADNQALLKFCEQCQLKALVVDQRIRPEMVAETEWRQAVRHVVDDYQNYPALSGYYIYDEPSARWFSALGEIHAEFRQRDPAHIPYLNLLPNYASPRHRGTATFREYLRRYVETVRPAVISYDHYPLLDTGLDRQDYFENLEAVRASAGTAQLPFWSIVLIAPHAPYRDPTADELRWQVYTSLAYGAKGLLYFTYWPPASLTTSAIVDATGKPTKRYDIVKELNRQVLAVGPTLLSLHSTAVYHTGSIPAGCTRLPTDAIVQVPSDKPLIVGCFADSANNDFVMLVNRDYRQARDVAVELRPDVVAVSRVSSVDGKRIAVVAQEQRFSLHLLPGEGLLLALQTRSDDPGAYRPVTEIKFEFNADEEDWVAEHSLTPPVVERGVLRSQLTGEDPYFTRTFLAIPPDRYRALVIRMKTSGTSAELFWQTSEHPRFESARRVAFDTVGDNRFHEYSVNLKQHRGWKNQAIRAIRLDPAEGAEAADQVVEIDYIRGE